MTSANMIPIIAANSAIIAANSAIMAPNNNHGGSLTIHDLGVVSLILLCAFIWFGFWIWVATELDRPGFAFICMFGIPFAIGSLFIFF